MSQPKQYNLTDNVNDDFKFDIRGLKYSMRYPLTEEIEELQNKSQELENIEAENGKKSEEFLAKSKEFENTTYDFISPIDHDVPVREALSKENVIVMKRFNTMIRTELSLEG